MNIINIYQNPARADRARLGDRLGAMGLGAMGLGARGYGDRGYGDRSYGARAYHGQIF